MEKRVAVMGIIVEYMDVVEQLNSILHDYSRYIIGRMGIPYREKNVNIISVAIDAPQNLTTTALQVEIRRAKRKFKNIDLVVIDYMQIMQNGSQNPYDWQQLVNVSKQLKAIARAEDIPIISALQEVKKAEEKGKKKEEHSQADIAYAKGITDNLDVVVKLHQSDMDKLANRMTFYFLKARRAAFVSNQGYSVRCNLSQQIIDLDSEKELKKRVGFIE